MITGEFEVDLNLETTVIVFYTKIVGRIKIDNVIDEFGNSVYNDLTYDEKETLKKKAIDHYLSNEDEYDCF